MMEFWVKLKDPMSDYEVSTLGNIRKRINVRHRHRNKPFLYLKTFESKGTLRVPLGASGKYTVSRLVYEAFCGDLVDGLVIAHLDGDFRNNVPENLVQVTQKENISHKKLHGTWQAGPTHPKSLSEHSYEAADKVRLLHAKASRSESGRLRRGEFPRIAQELGLSINFVRDVINKNAWEKEEDYADFRN